MIAIATDGREYLTCRVLEFEDLKGLSTHDVVCFVTRNNSLALGIVKEVRLIRIFERAPYFKIMLSYGKDDLDIMEFAVSEGGGYWEMHGWLSVKPLAEFCLVDPGPRSRVRGTFPEEKL